MAAKVIITGESKKFFGMARLADGVYTIKDFARYQHECDTTFRKEGWYEALGLFIDENHEDCIDLNGIARSRQQIMGNGEIKPIKAHGTLVDKMLALANRKTLDKAIEVLNSDASGLKGKQFKLEWVTYIPASHNTSYAYVPKLDLI